MQSRGKKSGKEQEEWKTENASEGERERRANRPDKGRLRIRPQNTRGATSQHQEERPGQDGNSADFLRSKHKEEGKNSRGKGRQDKTTNSKQKC